MITVDPLSATMVYLVQYEALPQGVIDDNYSPVIKNGEAFRILVIAFMDILIKTEDSE
jgi:hypothetical protein